MIEILQATGLCTIQDLGRPGRMHEGLAPGGALVPALLARANRAAGNADDAAAIEILGRLLIRAATPIVLGTDAGARELSSGDELEVTSEPRRVAYLAARGGIEAPIVLGSRSTQLSAGIGRVLRAGDFLGVRPPRSDAASAPAPFAQAGPIRILLGPDLHAFARDALGALTSAPYTILPASNRIGTRLSGPRLERTAALDVSRPMVRGAVEVPGDGQPIVLGPEHPTTGGYPIIAVIADEDLDAFHAIRIGGAARFQLR